MQSEAEAMLLDRYLPQYDVTETHAVIIDADTDRTWQAVRRSDLSRSAVIRVLLEMRSLPNRLQGFLKGRPSEPSRPPLTLDDMERAGFLLLGESPGHEIVFGTVVQPWKAVTDDEPAPQVEAGRFAVETREQVAQRVHGRPVRGVEELAGMLRAHPEVGSERLHRAAASASSRGGRRADRPEREPAARLHPRRAAGGCAVSRLLPARGAAGGVQRHPGGRRDGRLRHARS